MKVECAMTYGGAPVGRTVGCALEVKEAMALMEGAPGPSSLREKSLELTGMLLELGGVAEKGAGYAQAEAYLTSGAALKKFLEIVEAQGGNPKVKSEDIPVGNYFEHIRSPNSGYVDRIYNRRIVEIARLAGAPDDKGAGLYLHKKVGAIVKKGEPLMTIYSSTSQGVVAAVKSAYKAIPITVEGMLLEKYTGEA
jgi:AMP phosphorylase